jgi:aminoglycoside phosphotransferase (APT) family kinase protein
MNNPDIITQLKKTGLLRDAEIEIKTLSGGVSSEIWIVSDGKNRVIVKRARKKLMVDDDWYAETDRNRVEREFAEYIHRFLPGSVPKVLHSDDQHSFYAMEYLDESYHNWKSLLMSGKFNLQTAYEAADLLVKLHKISNNDQKARKKFTSVNYFESLRIDPYFITTGERHPDLKTQFLREADRLLSAREVLVHGDFSPKNLMVKHTDLVLLDHEVAHFGDSSFDLAFLMNHLVLKRLYQYRLIDRIPNLAAGVWNRYNWHMKGVTTKGYEERTGRLLLLLMLARIDGKSPVEYLNEIQREFVRNFVYSFLETNTCHVDKIIRGWDQHIKNRFIEDQ